jgi:hypothetical protein
MIAKPSAWWSLLRSLPALLFTVLVTAQTQADTQATIVALESSSTTIFAANEPFYVRVKYSTEQPINLWVHPYYKGKPVRAVLTSASSRYTGHGEVVSWFTLTEAGKVDEIRVIVGGGEPWRQWQAATQRLQLQWTDADVTVLPAADQAVGEPEASAVEPGADAAI